LLEAALVSTAARQSADFATNVACDVHARLSVDTKKPVDLTGLEKAWRTRKPAVRTPGCRR